MGHYNDCKSLQGNSMDCDCEEKTYRKAINVTVIIFCLELIGGLWVGSSAIVGDAFHVLADNAALIVALVTVRFLRLRKGEKNRMEYIGSTIVASLLLAVGIGVFFAGVDRLFTPHEVIGGWMIVVAIGSAIGNIFQWLILQGGHVHHGHTMHWGAIRHIISDFLQSIAIIIGSIWIYNGGSTAIDGALSVGIGVLLVYWSRQMFIDIKKGGKVVEHRDHHH